MNISVVIPLFNKRDSIERALNSVIKQKFKPYEIIVVNDGSTDGSEEIIHSIGFDDIELVNQKNAGVSAARNTGIGLAKSKWVAFLDADDVWHEEFLQTIYYLHKKYPTCNVLATAYSELDFNNELHDIVFGNLGFDSEDGVIRNYFESATGVPPPLWSSAICVCKKALDLVGGFPEGVRVGEDLITWARLSLNNQIGYSKKFLSVFIRDVNPWDVGRVTDFNDYVGKELLQIRTGFGSGEKKMIDGYIGYWYVMRSSSFLRAGMMELAREAVVNAARYGGIDLKKLLFFILSFSGKGFVNTVFRWYHK